MSSLFRFGSNLCVYMYNGCPFENVQTYRAPPHTHTQTHEFNTMLDSRLTALSHTHIHTHSNSVTTPILSSARHSTQRIYIILLSLSLSTSWRVYSTPKLSNQSTLASRPTTTTITICEHSSAEQRASTHSAHNIKRYICIIIRHRHNTHNTPHRVYKYARSARSHTQSAPYTNTRNTTEKSDCKTEMGQKSKYKKK